MTTIIPGELVIPRKPREPSNTWRSKAFCNFPWINFCKYEKIFCDFGKSKTVSTAATTTEAQHVQGLKSGNQ